MTRPTPLPALFRHSSRIEAFSDAVFAIALTLLVLDIHIPPIAHILGNLPLWHALAERWPSYFALILSFGTIYCAWVGHHQLLQRAKVIGPALVWINGLFLLWIMLLPFVTALVAEYLTHPGDAVSVAVYAGLNSLISLTFLWLYRVVQQHGAGDESQIRSASRVAMLSTLICWGAALLAFATPVGAMILVGCIWLRNAWLQSQGNNLLTASS